MRKVVLTVLVVAATAAAPAASGPQAAAGTLDLKVTFPMISDGTPCPAGAPPGECRARIGNAVVRGLGSLTDTYTWRMGIGPRSE